jgi:hypothetical protein
MKAKQPRQRFSLVLEPLPDPIDGGYRLKRALKCLLRSFGLKCIAVWDGDASRAAIADRPLDWPADELRNA